MKSVEIEISDERLEEIKKCVKEIKKSDIKAKSELVQLIKNCQLFSELEAEYNIEDEKVQILF